MSIKEYSLYRSVTKYHNHLFCVTLNNESGDIIYTTSYENKYQSYSKILVSSSGAFNRYELLTDIFTEEDLE